MLTCVRETRLLFICGKTMAIMQQPNVAPHEGHSRSHKRCECMEDGWLNILPSGMLLAVQQRVRQSCCTVRTPPQNEMLCQCPLGAQSWLHMSKVSLPEKVAVLMQCMRSDWQKIGWYFALWPMDKSAAPSRLQMAMPCSHFASQTHFDQQLMQKEDYRSHPGSLAAALHDLNNYCSRWTQCLVPPRPSEFTDFQRANFIASLTC